MRRYETITIIDPDLSEEERRPILERVEGLMPQQDGLLVEIDQWGARKLAYEIKKKMRGFYVRFDYCGTGELVNEMERFFRIDDRVLKYMTVLQQEDVDIDKIKEMIAAAAEAEKEKLMAETAAKKEPPASDAAEAATAAATADDAETSAAGATETSTADEAEAEEAAESAEAEPAAAPEADATVADKPAEDQSEPDQVAEPDAEAEADKK